jgi:glycosyltransferase involved in cell wall biosynthesis
MTIDVANADKPKRRVLMASHSHPRLTRGGAEISAYEMYKVLSQDPDCEAWFLGAQGSGGSTDRTGAVFTQPFSEREYIYHFGAFDWFKFANRDPSFAVEFTELLLQLRPDVVHFHHFIVFGVEVFALVRRVLPEAQIILTLHEYLAICHHYGQMVTKGREALCYESGPLHCIKCFPEFSPADFFLRKLYIERFFADVDQFVSPSHFLAGRMIEWGLAPERISVAENLIAPQGKVPPKRQRAAGGPLRVGFFGQISRLKGINVVFEAAALLEKVGDDSIVFDIHGDYRNQPPEFQEDFLKRLEKVGGNVILHGPYEPQRVDALMQSVDMVIVPSIWWENSPVVIQEAFRNGTKVICSDIGGMLEKVGPRWCFARGIASELCRLLKDAQLGNIGRNSNVLITD